MKRRDALKVGLGLVGVAGLTRWDALLGAAGAQAPACSLVPQQTAGPFYFDANQVRRDITEGRPGLALELALKVVDADSCAPVAGALVDVWHADAAGIYSGYGRRGDGGNVDASEEDFMRGIQIADEEGMVEFTTVYPGWYPGRTPHIHFMVFLAEERAVTSQLYFPDDTSAGVYEQEPYAARGSNPTTNLNDVLSATGDLDALQMTVVSAGEGYRAEHVLGIVGGETAAAPTTWGGIKDGRS